MNPKAIRTTDWFVAYGHLAQQFMVNKGAGLVPLRQSSRYSVYPKRLNSLANKKIGPQLGLIMQQEEGVWVLLAVTNRIDS